MILKYLSLAHVRAFEQADFNFQPSMNLLVSVNGTGKSTILDVLRMMFSYTLPQFTAARIRPIPFAMEDITVGQTAFTADLDFQIDQIDFNHLVHVPRRAYELDNQPGSLNRLAQYVGRRRVQFRRETLEGYTDVGINELCTVTNEEVNLGRLQKAERQPLVVYYSARRSLPDLSIPTRGSRADGQTAAFTEALSHRDLRLREYVDWCLQQDALGQETPDGPYGRRLRVLNDAVTSFLDGCHNLRAVREPKSTLVLDKGGKTLDIRMLSGGERSMIALVLDLARRLTLANPGLEFPLRNGKGVVLIDELDLHLHPRWQRTIVEKLTHTFPNCQFIATTHSPQIVGEASPDNIILIENGTATRPNQSLGMDTNWILRHLMGGSERDEETKQQLERIEVMIEDEQYDAATRKIDELRHRLGDFPDLVNLQTRIDMIDYLSDAKDE